MLSTFASEINPVESGVQTSSKGQCGAAIIQDYFRERYRPEFRRGNAVHCADGREVAQGEACSAPDSEIVLRLFGATDAPRLRGVPGQTGPVNRDALPGFFKRWAPVAWGDLIRSLPDEDAAELAPDGAAAEAFRQTVRDALLSEVTLGDTIGHSGVTQIERNSLIGWCVKFSKPGPWRSIRGKRIWCKLVEREAGELTLMVAVRHELFAQLRADRSLVKMGATKFARRAGRYGVGKASRDERPHGQSAIVLDDAFVAELTAGLPEEPRETELSGART